MPNGTITPLGMTLGEPKRECEFTFLKAKFDQQIQFSCSTLRLSSGSYLNLYGVIGLPESYSVTAVILNRVYYSTRKNDLRLSSKIGSSDTFNCTWTTIPLEKTSQFKLCRHAEVAADNGTITPIEGDTGQRRNCSFHIKAYPNQKIELVCSVLKLTIAGSYLRIKGLLESANPIVLNQVYTSTRVSLMPNKANAATTIKPISTTMKKTTQSVTTTTVIKRNVTTTTTPSPTNIPKFFVCRDTNSSAATGILLPYRNITSDEAIDCAFFIVAPPGQQIQITCSTININGYHSYFRIAEYGEFGSEQDILVNDDYFSINNSLSVTASFDYPDWFECKWTTLPKDNTTNFKLCRHFEAKTANGTIQPFGGYTTPDRICSISIVAPSDYQIEFSCSSLNFSGYLMIKGVLDGYSDNGMNGDINVQVLGRKYYSINNEMKVESSFGYQARFNCSYKAIPKEITTESKFCRHAKATAANGTISPMAGDTRDIQNCAFKINAASNQQIRITCSVILLTSPDSYLSMLGVIDRILYLNEDTIVNRVYTAKTGNEIEIKSVLGSQDWIECKWTTTPKRNTTDFKLCLDEVTTSSTGTIQPLERDTEQRSCDFSIRTASSGQQIQMSCSTVKLNNICRDSVARTANGTIQPLTGDPGPLRECRFTIYAPPNQQIRISCSTLNFTSPDSYLWISGIIGTAYPPDAILNRVYYSNPYDSYYINRIELPSGINQGDRIDCKWTTIPVEITPNSKLCRHRYATMPNGTITPLGMTLGEPNRECEFNIKANLDQQIQFSCSTLRLSSGSYLNLDGVIGQSETDSAVTLNRIYYSTRSNDLRLSSKIGSSDTFNCTWATIPLEITSQFKLCRHAEATAANGTITPITGDKRSCLFLIKAYSYQKIQISCSVLKLTSTGSYLRIEGLVKGANPPVLNQVYTSTVSNDITLSSSFDKSDTFNCSWTITTRY
ncbi:hypothetical protein DAPPUDRAFT_316720 [Daphnia pulex]|uniref:CUB domain-containing protein n=1 Tax=Daphnia pulex TaxID=6669 RepID=E9GDT0_DAPPU|nr:hypothetical protein DAPPUDRAFT_316720 [Daphnia pulex]|eukprot:EFX82426.1 hypothetical protein DAPPUDRAFT_316720 [Daphnia pulex]